MWQTIRERRRHSYDVTVNVMMTTVLLRLDAPCGTVTAWTVIMCEAKTGGGR
jgi:hypothetical protein